MKNLLNIVLVALLAMAGVSPQQQYVEKYSALAVEEMHRTGVPASITLAQGLLESGAGQSRLAREGNNHFGIKCHRDWKGKRIFHDDDAKGECFRSYDSAEQSFRDHSDFLRYYDRYKFLFSYETTDYKAWAYGLKKAGYATSPTYAQKLIETVEKYDLSRFDTADRSEVPQDPLSLERPRRAEGAPDEVMSFSLSREMLLNGVRFVYSTEGETYRSLAEKYHISLRKILSYNDLEEDCELLPGTVVYVQRKKGRAAEGLDKYIVNEDGESLRDICQRFAVRLNAIRNLNDIPEEYTLRKEDTIRLR